MTIHQAHLSERSVYDPTGEKLGKVSDVIFDGNDIEPAWLVVNPGLFKAEHYVPVAGAAVEGDDTLVVPYEAETVRSSPKVTRDHVLSPVVRTVLCDHYEVAAS